MSRTIYGARAALGCTRSCDKLKKPPEARAGTEKHVGPNGVYGSSYHNEGLDLILTVAPDWILQSTGQILSKDGSIAGLVQASASSPAGFSHDIAEYHRAIAARSSTYTENSRRYLAIDGEEGRIIDVVYQPIGGSTSVRSIIAHINKGKTRCHIEFSGLAQKWTSELVTDVEDTILGVTRQEGLQGQLRRALNQYEYAHEGRDLAYFFGLLADSAWRDLYDMSRKRVVKTLDPIEFYKEIREVDLWRMRYVRTEGALAGVLVGSRIQSRSPPIPHAHGRLLPHFLTFKMERGLWRLCGEYVGVPPVISIWGTNLALDKGQFHASPPPLPTFSYSLVGPDLVVDASKTRDWNVKPTYLQLRWDWEADGTWDTSWSNIKKAKHTYAEAGWHKVALEVRNPYGLGSKLIQEVRPVTPSITLQRIHQVSAQSDR